MAGKKDKCVVFVGTGLTSTQASNFVSEIAKAKNKVAPQSRGTAAITSKEGISRLLQNKTKRIK